VLLIAFVILDSYEVFLTAALNKLGGEAVVNGDGDYFGHGVVISFCVLEVGLGC
jgi:hypothetical protein